MKPKLQNAAIIIIFISSFCSLSAQNIDFLYLEKFASFKRIKVHTGSDIKIIMTNGIKIKGTIMALTDSSIIFENQSPILISEIAYFYKKTFLFQLISKTTLLMGVGYLTLGTINRTMNGMEPIINEDMAKVGGIFIGVGLLTAIFSERKLEISQSKWRIKPIIHLKDEI